MRTIALVVSSIAICVVAGSGSALLASDPIRLVSDFSLSPDGERLAFAVAGDVWTASTAGGAATRLTFDRSQDRNPRFSRDGKLLAFVSNRTGTSQVFTMPVAGGAPTQRTWHSEGYAIEEFAPGNDVLLTRGSRDHFWRSPQRLIEVDLQKRTAERVVFDDYAAGGTYSPDGQRILFVREGFDWWRKGYVGTEAAQIWLYDKATAAFTELVHSDRGARNPMWRGDGSGFYFASEQDGTYNLYERDLGNATTKKLTDFQDDGVTFAACSADGKTIVFRRGVDLHVFRPASGEPPRRIDLVNDGEPLRRETTRRTLTTAESAAYSPDALEIAFIAGGDLFVMDTELREPVRVTNTPESESEPLFSPDGKAIYFVSDQQGQSDVWRVERADEDQYWWRNRDFVMKRVTQDVEIERQLRISPDGTRLSFVRGAGDLMITDLEGRAPKRLLASFDAPSYEWSPDSKWIAYSVADENFNSDVWIVPADGSAPPYNVSVHPDNDYEAHWSLDGRILAFVGKRLQDEVDIHWVWLRKEDEDQDSRDRKLKKALEKMEKERKADKPAKGKDDSKGDKPAEKPDEKKPEEKKPEEKKPEVPEVKIDFDGLRDRLHPLRIADSNEGGLLFIDDKKLAFNATIDGKAGVYSVEFPDDLTPKPLPAKFLSRPTRAAKAKVWGGVSAGVPTTTNAQGAQTSSAFSTQQEIKVGERFRTAFVMAWRVMRDGFYDDRLNNRNWDAIRRKYEDAAYGAVDVAQLQQVVQLMLGELNGSHLGFSATEPPESGPPAFVDTTAHLGLRFDPTFKGPGWKVQFVWKKGPCAEGSAKVEVGEVVLAVDGRAVDPALDPTEVLNGTAPRDIKLRVQSADKSKERDVVVRPTTYGAMRQALYDEWIDFNRKTVDQKSNGKLGYLHIAGMDWSSFQRFDAELYRIGYGKDGLIIDVRANGGGSTADHLLTSLTQPAHAIAVGRGGKAGYPQDRQVYASWSKPILVLCDQNSFSNAEIFAHAIQTLKRGKLVGVRTAGGVISTGGTEILDIGFLRLPFRGWFLPGSGEDMELNGAEPDYTVWPKPGELPAGKDEQLAKGIEILLGDVKAWNERPQPPLRKASERPGR